MVETYIYFTCDSPQQAAESDDKSVFVLLIAWCMVGGWRYMYGPHPENVYFILKLWIENLKVWERAFILQREGMEKGAKVI